MGPSLALLISGLIWINIAFADQAPISGIVKAIDPVAQTVTLEAAAKGKTSEVRVDAKPASRIVRFVRSAEPGMIGFVERAAALSDLKLGWIVSVATKHDGGPEVADMVKVVRER